MASTSDDVEVRCKTCGKPLGANLTIRREDSERGRRIYGIILWALALARHPECQAPRS